MERSFFEMWCHKRIIKDKLIKFVWKERHCNEIAEAYDRALSEEEQKIKLEIK